MSPFVFMPSGQVIKCRQQSPLLYEAILQGSMVAAMLPDDLYIIPGMLRQVTAGLVGGDGGGYYRRPTDGEAAGRMGAVVGHHLIIALRRKGGSQSFYGQLDGHFAVPGMKEDWRLDVIVMKQV